MGHRELACCCGLSDAICPFEEVQPSLGKGGTVRFCAEGSTCWGVHEQLGVICLLLVQWPSNFMTGHLFEAMVITQEFTAHNTIVSHGALGLLRLHRGTALADAIAHSLSLPVLRANPTDSSKRHIIPLLINF